MIEPTWLSLSDERLLAVYEFTGPVESAESRVNALRVEQTIEFPADLVPDDDIQNEIVGRVESLQPVGDERPLSASDEERESTPVGSPLDRRLRRVL